MRMLRVSVVVSVGVHLLILSVVSVVVAQYAGRPVPEIRTFQVSVHHVVRPRVQVSDRAPDVFQKPVVGPLPALPQAVQPAPISASLAKRPPVRERPIPKDLRPMAPARPKLASAPAPVRQMPSQPRETYRLADEFPTAIPTPVRVQTTQPANATIAPTPRATVAPPPTPIVTQTPASNSAPDDLAVKTVTTSAAVRPATPMPLSHAATGSISPLSDQKTALTEDPSGERPETRPQADQTQIDQERLLKTYVHDLAARLQAAQTYPRKARRNGWEGTVMVKLHLEPTGAVERVELAQSSGVDVLDQAALQAVLDAQPLPAFPEGVSAPALIVNIPIRYQLK